MKFANERMTDPAVQQKKLGIATRSKRNGWAESIEELVRAKCPYPCSYDVSQTQSSRFTEYTYTELLGAMWVATQSQEINCRIMQIESQKEATVSLDEIQSLVQDKYLLNEKPHSHSGAREVIFMAGHNMLDVVSVEQVHRLIHENDDVVIKPHPITNEESLAFLGARFGWNRIAPKDASGYKMLMDADVVYTSTASEFAISGTAFGKKVVNVSNWFNEPVGAYWCISRLLFNAHKESIEKAQKVLCSLFSNKTGIITPFMTDVNSAVQDYYDYSLFIKEMYQDFRDKGQNATTKPKEVQ